MYKKLISMVSVILVLGLASTTYGVLIGDFEDSMDGWAPASADIQTGFSVNGATLNQKSLWIETPTSNVDALVLDLFANNLVDEFKNNLKISMDITRLVSEWVDSGSSWCDLVVFVNAGSSEEGSTWVLRDQVEGTSTWNPFLGDDPINFVFDYSLILSEIDFDNLQYLQIIIGTNWGNYSPGGVFYIDNMQMFGAGAAYAPDPADGSRNVSSTITISWTPGLNAETHDVYLGTDPNSVQNADRTNPMGVLLVQDFDASSYELDELESGKTYYWRVDAVAGGDIYKGDLWSFSTVYAQRGYVLGDWEGTLDGWYLWPQNPATYSFSPVGATLNQQSIKMSVNVSGTFIWILSIFLSPEELEVLKANDLFSLDVTWLASDWLGDGSWCQVNWIAINAEGIGWNQLDAPVSDTGNPDELGAWNPMSFGELHTRTIVWDYSEIPVADIPEGGWCQFSIATNHDSAFTRAAYYFDNARLINSFIASDPVPNDREREVQTQPTLRWSPGSNAKTHNVYFGDSLEDITAVNQDNLASYPNVAFSNVRNTSYKTSPLDYDTTYYWRVDEVNPDVSGLWKGDVWRFTTGNYVIVDDFEDYNDYPPDEVWNTWIDGYGDAANGSTSGYPDPDFVIGEHYMETTIVHSGRQSMPILYDNTAGLSEVTRTLNANWTQNNVATLTLFFYGDAENAAEPLYIALNGSAVVTNSNANAANVTEWTRWDIPLQAFTDVGVNLSNVRTLSIGLGNKTSPQVGGGSGCMFIDDIRLYRQ